MSETEGEAAPAAVVAAAPKSKMVPLLLLMNTLFGGAVLFMALKRPAPAAAPAAAPAEATKEGGEGHGPPGAAGNGQMPGPILKLDSFVIQLRTVDADRYARVAFDLELSNEADRPAVVARQSQIRDAIIAYFSDRTLDELRGSEGMERTKQALLKRFDDLVPGRRVRGLFVSDFVIQ